MKNRLPGRCIRALAVLSVLALLGAIAWLAAEARMASEDAHALHLQDWPFTVCFCVFLIAAYLALALFFLLRLRKKCLAAVLAMVLLLPFGYMAKTGLELKAFVFGSKVYANADIYVKSYFAWEPDYYFEYVPDGLFRIRDGERLGFGGGTIEDYIGRREAE